MVAALDQVFAFKLADRVECRCLDVPPGPHPVRSDAARRGDAFRRGRPDQCRQPEQNGTSRLVPGQPFHAGSTVKRSPGCTFRASHMAVGVENLMARARLCLRMDKFAT